MSADRSRRGGLPAAAPRGGQGGCNVLPPNNGLGSDNAAPRAFGRLSDEAIASLVLILLAFERAGSWSAAINLVLIVLLYGPLLLLLPLPHAGILIGALR